MDMEKQVFIVNILIVLVSGAYALTRALGNKSSHQELLRGRDVIVSYIRSNAFDPFTFKLQAWLMHIVSGLSFLIIVLCWISYYLNQISYTRTMVFSIFMFLAVIFSTAISFKFWKMYRKLKTKNSTTNIANVISFHLICFAFVALIKYSIIAF
jgi:magnesium-transporting ATPase (P-type)